MLDDPWFPRFATKQFLTDLTPLLQKRGQTGPDPDFVNTSVALCKHPYQTGALYALPYVGNTQLFFYRKDIFEKHSLKEPLKWDDVLAAAKTIQEKESEGGKTYGYVMRAAHGNAAVADFMSLNAKKLGLPPLNPVDISGLKRAGQAHLHFVFPNLC